MIIEKTIDEQHHRLVSLGLYHRFWKRTVSDIKTAKIHINILNNISNIIIIISDNTAHSTRLGVKLECKRCTVRHSMNFSLQRFCQSQTSDCFSRANFWDDTMKCTSLKLVFDIAFWGAALWLWEWEKWSIKIAHLSLHHPWLQKGGSHHNQLLPFVLRESVSLNERVATGGQIATACGCRFLHSSSANVSISWNPLHLFRRHQAWIHTHWPPQLTFFILNIRLDMEKKMHRRN